MLSDDKNQIFHNDTRIRNSNYYISPIFKVQTKQKMIWAQIKQFKYLGKYRMKLLNMFYLFKKMYIHSLIVNAILKQDGGHISTKH